LKAGDGIGITGFYKCLVYHLMADRGSQVDIGITAKYTKVRIYELAIGERVVHH